MFRFDAEKSVHFCDGLRRRDFLHAGSLAFLGLTLQDFEVLKAAGAVQSARDVNCILLFLVGGPSQLDTWDMKPDAPSEIRGPYKAIATNVPGIQISEIFPRMAKHADKFALLRSVYHTGAGVHDAGHQMMQTGRFFQFGDEQPHFGCVVSKLKGPKGDAPPHVLLPRPIGNTGGNLPHGQNGGLPRQDLRSVRPERRSVGAGLRGARPALAGLPAADPRRRPGVDAASWSIARCRTSNRCRTRGCSTATSTRPTADVVRDGARGVRPVGGGRQDQGPLRPQPLRHELPAGAPPDRARRPVRHGQHVRDGLQRDHLGHPRLGAVQPDRAATATCVGPMFDHAYSSLLEDLHDRGLLAGHAGARDRESSAARRRSTRPAAATTGRTAGRC